MKNLIATTLTVIVCLISMSACSKSEDASGKFSASASASASAFTSLPDTLFNGPFTAGIKWAMKGEEKQCTFVEDLLKKKNFKTTNSVTFQGGKLEYQCEIIAESNNLMTKEEFAPIVEEVGKINSKSTFSFSYHRTHQSK
jgi:hypothetical protein